MMVLPIAPTLATKIAAHHAPVLAWLVETPRPYACKTCGWSCEHDEGNCIECGTDSLERVL